MKPVTQTCDHHRLEAFLQGDLNAAEEDDLAVHLNECVACRERLEASAAEPACWSKAGELLQPNGYGDQDSAARPPQRSLQVQHLLDTFAPTDDPEMLGRLGVYEVSGVVGSGGMGVVLKGLDKSLDRIVAIKVLAPHLATSGAARQRFAREAKAAAAVLHPNVMAIHSVSNDESLPYLVMPYLRGPSLQKRIDEEGPLPVGEILRIGSQIAAGLAGAHSQGLVHRDIKPANILLEEGVERVAITDFGLARAVDDATMTRTGVIAGTPQFMSPEQARGESVDQRSDLFSLGSVMYMMCTGRPPFRAETSYGILRRITDTEPRPIREINPDVPEWLCQLIAKLMSKQPEDRFASASEVAELLEDCLAHVQQPAAVPLPESCRETNQPDRVSGRFAWKPWANAANARRLLIGAAFVFAMIFAGILIVLELNKGTLTIESDADDVPIRIMQDDKIVERLTVSKAGTSIRIAAGQYVVEIGGEFDGLMLKDETVSLRRGGKEVVRIIKQRTQKDAKPRAPVTPHPDVERLQGVWAMDICDSATKGFGDTQAVVRDWRWDFRGNEITWARSHGKVWKMKFTVDPTKTPKEIDLTYLDGPFKGKQSLGIYRWGGIDGKTLQISVQDPGVDVPRPQSIGMKSYESSLIFLHRPDADAELASLQGNWKVDIFYTDSLPKPAGKGDERRLVIRGNEMSWTDPDSRQIRMSFTIDPTKLPHEIDATFLSGPLNDDFSSPLLAGKCLGMYERRGDTLWLCLADPGSNAPRPKNVAYETNEGRSMIGLTRVASTAGAGPGGRENSSNHQRLQGAEVENAPAELDRGLSNAPDQTPRPALPSDLSKEHKYYELADRLQSELSSHLPTTAPEIIDIYCRVFDRLPTDAELSQAFETIVEWLKRDEMLREKTLQARKVKDWIGAATKDSVDAFVKEHLARPETPRDSWVLEFALHFGGDLSAKGIERAYERALARKPANAETIATFEWLIDKLLTDEQFPKYAGKGLFAGFNMLDKRWDASFHNMTERLRKELDPEHRKAAWSIEDYYKYADEFFKVRPAPGKQKAPEAKKSTGTDTSSAPVYRGKTLGQWLDQLKASHDIDGENAINAVREEASPEQLARSIKEWMAMVDRERDTDALCSTIGILCASAGKEHSDRALDGILATIERQPTSGPQSFDANRDLMREIERAIRRLDEDIVRARMRVRSIAAADHSLDDWLANARNNPTSSPGTASAAVAQRMRPRGKPGVAYFPSTKVIRVAGAALFPDAVTDESGRFRINGLGPDRLVSLEIEDPAVAKEWVYAVTREMQPVPFPSNDPETRINRYFGARSITRQNLHNSSQESFPGSRAGGTEAPLPVDDVRIGPSCWAQAETSGMTNIAHDGKSCPTSGALSSFGQQCVGGFRCLMLLRRFDVFEHRL